MYMKKDSRNNIIKLLALIAFSATLSQCTYNISMAHTQGHATDVIDDTQSNHPNISPQLSIPASAL